MTTKTIHPVAAAIMFLLIVFSASTVHAQGGQANAGPDTTICKDQCIVIGTPMPPEWCFHWTPHDGLSNPHVAMPQACPQTTTTYTLTVTGPEYSFISTDQVVVTVVEISDIAFSVNPLPLLPSSSTSQASATTTSGGNLIWSIEGANLGATINPTTGLITTGTQSGTITIRATDENNPTCFVEASLCLGTGDDCCPDYYDATKVFGPISVSIPGGISPVGPADAQGYCTYQVSAAVSVEMQGVFQKTYSIPGVSLSWKEKTTNPSDYKDVTVSWNGSYDAGTFGLISANITAVSLSVSSAGDLTGSVTFDAYLNQDQSIGGIAILRSGLSGNFTYTYTTGGGGGSIISGGGFGGTWDFGGVTGFHVDLVKGSTVIATVTAQSFDANGNINNAELIAATPAVWTTNNFTLSLEQLNLMFNYSIPNNEIEFVSGTGQIKASNVTNVEGEFELGLTFSPTNVTATVSMTGAKAFSCTVSGALTADFDYSFNVNSIAGNNISAKHDDFEQSFTGVEFEIADGALEKFGIGQIEAKFKNKITFSMTNATYVKATGILEFNAKVVLPSIQMEVNHFRINNTGQVTVGNLSANINQSPVTASINVGWSTDQFQGNFAGSFAGNVAINGSLVIGATATFNYGHFYLQVATPGIPLGGSGLKMKTLAGEFGYNWKAPETDGAAGVPEQGTLTIGFGMGIADLADIVLIEGYVRLTLGAATQIYLQGDVKVTANPPHYFHGQLKIYYTLGSSSISGSISSEIKFPPSTGNVVSFNTGSVQFAVGGNKWSVASGTMAGKIFNQIDVTASVNVWAWLSSPGSINGTLSGTVDWTYNLTYAYPSNFNPSSCSTADATDNSLGFGVKGTLDLHLGGSINAQMNQNGLVGTFNAQASAQATLWIKWPCFLVCGWDCVDEYSASVEGTLNIQKTSSGARIHGTVTFSSGGETESGDVDFNI